MFSKYTLQLNKGDAELLRKLKSQAASFAVLPDYLVLFKDYQAFEEALPAKVNKIPLIGNKLGAWQAPLTSLEKFDDKYIFLVAEAKKYKAKLGFSCGSSLFSSTLGIEIEDLDAEDTLFSLSTLYTAWMEEASQEEIACKLGDILYLASFFQNRRPLYAKLHALLVSKQKQYAKYFGAKFVEDLTLLFSVGDDGSEKLFPLVTIATAKLEKTSVKRLKSSKKEVVLGTSPFYRRIGKSWSYTDLDFKLTLTGANKLSIVIYPTRVSTYSAGNLAEAEENKEIENFIKKYLNDWVNQLIATVNLAANIYELYRTKILLERV